MNFVFFEILKIQSLSKKSLFMKLKKLFLNFVLKYN